MRIALFNDTGLYPHVGCRAVSSGHDRMFARAGLTVAYRSYYREWHDVAHRLRTRRVLAQRALKERLSEIDVVIVNGEGTIHHGGGAHLMTILRIAQKMRRRTYLVNAVLQDLAVSDLEVLAKLTMCTVRDASSARYLKRRAVPYRIVFDALIEAAFVPVPAVNMAGRIVVTDWHGNRQKDVGKACTQLLKDLGDDAVFYPLDDEVRAAQWAHAVADFQTARLVVTGRHHGVCLAALAGVPFVALGSNTWKIEGLLRLFPGRPQVCDPKAKLRSVCRAAETQIAQAATIKRWVKAQRPLTTFDRLRLAVAA